MAGDIPAVPARVPLVPERSDFLEGDAPAAAKVEDFGWNWTYWDHVQRRLVREPGDQSPIRAALTAPDAPLGVHTSDPPRSSS